MDHNENNQKDSSTFLEWYEMKTINFFSKCQPLKILTECKFILTTMIKMVGQTMLKYNVIVYLCGSNGLYLHCIDGTLEKVALSAGKTSFCLLRLTSDHFST